MINWNTRHEKKDVRLQQGLDLKQWGCYYRPYNLKASVEERVIMGKVCACACLKLHLVSIVSYLFTEMCQIPMFSESHIALLYSESESESVHSSLQLAISKLAVLFLYLMGRNIFIS